MRLILPILAASAVLIGATVQSELPAPLATHFDKLETASSLTSELVIRKLGSPAVAVKFTFGKPNVFRMETPETLIVSDGKVITTLTKKDSSYTEEPVNEATVRAFSYRPELALWRSFFVKTARKEITSARVGVRRNLQGNEVTEVAVTFKDGLAGTLFLDNKLGIARGASLKQEAIESIVLASKIDLSKETPADTFKITLPAGAKKKEPVSSSPGYADVQAILSQSCMPCHSAQNAKAGFDLTQYQGVSRSVVPGNSAGSILIKSLRGQGAKQMPMRAAPLSEDKIKLISAWIDAGAKEK